MINFKTKHEFEEYVTETMDLAGSIFMDDPANEGAMDLHARLQVIHEEICNNAFAFANTATCQRCGKSWTPRTARPAVCPYCGSARWETPRSGNEPGRKPKKQKAEKWGVDSENSR